MQVLVYYKIERAPYRRPKPKPQDEERFLFRVGPLGERQYYPFRSSASSPCPDVGRKSFYFSSASYFSTIAGTPASLRHLIST